jgi:ribonuclease HI
MTKVSRAKPPRAKPPRTKSPQAELLPSNSLPPAALLKLLARGLSVTEIAREHGVARAELVGELRRLAEAVGGGTEAGASAGDAQRLVVQTDGASRGNPGPAAIGIVVLKDGKVLAEKGQPIGETTNNVAEYRAVIAALEMARTYGAREVEVRMDSELVVRQMTGQYRVKDARLAVLAGEVDALVRCFDLVDWIHVPRGENSRADALANRALDHGISP